MIQQVDKNADNDVPAAMEAAALRLNLLDQVESAAFAFRGYNVTNLGRTPELFEQPAYRPTLEKRLIEAAAICSEATGRPVDLIRRVQLREETTLATYSEAIALIAGVELAQLDILSEQFGVQFSRGMFGLGYSLGEVVALAAAGVYPIDAMLIPILKLSDDCAELAHDIRLGVVFSRGPLLDISLMERFCVEVTARNEGAIEISTYLSPNTVLVLAQGRALDLFKELLKERLNRQVSVKENPNRWPPIHTAIVRQRCVADRAAVMLSTATGGMQAPTIPIISCITGDTPYSDYNSRRILSDWVDKPQRLWDVLERILNSDVETMFHLGPDPNIIPATMSRICQNVEAQLKTRSLAGFGLRAVSTIVRARPWLAHYISRTASLLRAPRITHVVIEDWLLANVPK